MYHPLLLPREVLNELPALLDGLRPHEAEASAPCYRSEAFAEDLLGSDAAEPAARRPARAGRAPSATPLGMAFADAVLSLFGRVA